MLRETLRSALAEAAKRLYGIDATPEISYPDPRFGDFSTNLAFQLAAQLKKLPPKVAEELAGSVKNDAITEIKTTGGFLNIVISEAEWIKQIEAMGVDLAHNNSGQGRSVLVEFISANPTGPLTLGNGRGGYSGDVLANVLKASAYRVSREYYINDAGVQITKVTQSVLWRDQLGRAVFGNQKWEEPEGEYRGEYIGEITSRLKKQIRETNKNSAKDFEKQTEPKVVEDILTTYIKPAVKKMGINFDSWFSEKKQLHETGKIETILKLLKEKQLTEKKEKAVWLRGGDNDNRERVLVKSDGSYTYLLVDIAYHWHKLVERKFDKAINLWGADHGGQVASLQSVLASLGLANRLQIVLFQLVRLIRGGEVVKVSKRAGSYVTLDELLAEIPADVARFFFLMRSHDTHMDFDLDLAREQSQNNPYYYVMYAYVRAQSILEEAAKKQLKPAQTISHKLGDKEKKLIKQLVRLPELVADIASSYEVHQLTFYGLELAKLFHDYYEDTHIIKLPSEEAESRLLTVAKLKTAMEAYFTLLGVKPLLKM